MRSLRLGVEKGKLNTRVVAVHKIRFYSISIEATLLCLLLNKTYLFSLTQHSFSKSIKLYFPVCVLVLTCLRMA